MPTSGSVTGTVKTGGRLYMEWYNVNRNVAANTSRIDQYLNFQLTNGYSVSATETGSLWINGSQQSYNNGSQYHGTNTAWTLSSRGSNFTHDANGNLTVGGLAGYFTSGWSTLGSFSLSDFTVYIDRLPLAPTFSTPTADTITTNSARLGVDFSSYGHGTSAASIMYYRLLGSSTWISLGQRNDGAGASYWNVTSLSPGKTYQYYAYGWNNNGDTVTSSTYTFKTKSGVKVILPTGVVEDRVVKRITPDGTVTERVVTKVNVV